MAPKRRNLCQYGILLALVSSAFTTNAIADSLVDAAMAMDAERVQVLLDQGYDVNSTDSDNYTGLIAAAEVGNLQIVRNLIERGADLNKRNKYGATALHKVLDAERPATKKLNRERVSIALLLIGNGVEVNARGHNNTTPLHVAVMRADISVIEALLESGADKDARTKKGITPRHIAKLLKDKKVIALLED